MKEVQGRTNKVLHRSSSLYEIRTRCAPFALPLGARCFSIVRNDETQVSSIPRFYDFTLCLWFLRFLQFATSIFVRSFDFFLLLDPPSFLSLQFSRLISLLFPASLFNSFPFLRSLPSTLFVFSSTLILLHDPSFSSLFSPFYSSFLEFDSQILLLLYLISIQSVADLVLSLSFVAGSTINRSVNEQLVLDR